MITAGHDQQKHMVMNPDLTDGSSRGGDSPVSAGLVTRARNGDKQAWDALVERYAALIWSIYRRHGLADADSEDAAQNVFARRAGGGLRTSPSSPRPASDADQTAGAVGTSGHGRDRTENAVKSHEQLRSELANKAARALTWPTASRMNGVARRMERLTRWAEP